MTTLELSQGLDKAISIFYSLIFAANDQAIKTKLRRAQDHLRHQLAEQNAVILAALESEAA
jgi:hypothetical protein